MGMDPMRVDRLAAFVTWVQSHITGDEKGESQVFLDRLFRAFGHEGAKEAGATYEQRAKKLDGRGTSFVDLVWKPIALVEMKKRGENLTKHYRQAFDYWAQLVPGRPRYVILCNFDEFWIYDFDAQIDSPLDKVKVVDLPRRWSPLAFLLSRPETPRFSNDQVAVTRKAADHLAECFNKLVCRQVNRTLAQRFILRLVVALFAEDLGLLDRYMVAGLLDDCKTKQDSYDLLGDLFDAMNAPGKTPGGRYAGVHYFNGGLFEEPARIELRFDEVNHLKAAAGEDWSKVRPEIFGALFEHSLGKEERHAYGAHFTSAVDIMKIVGPTIVEPWRERIEVARSPQTLRGLRDRMHHFTVLDPACGSGNFLYIAYRELKRLDARIAERLGEMTSQGVRDDVRQLTMGFVTARQFYGLDVNPFAVELAKVTMMIARKFAIDELGTQENALPLDNLDTNFQAVDALIDPEGRPTSWPPVDVIIGNPPFLGAKRLKPERGVDYVNAVRRAYPDVPGMADYCVYWFRKAHDVLPCCTDQDPFAGRAGLVGTQNIRNNQSRVGGLDHIARDGTIIEAVDNQPWSGEAHVHVAIANWVKSQDPRVLPKGRRLWSAVANSQAPQGFDLRLSSPDSIHSSLSGDTDLSAKRPLECNQTPKVCFQGKIPGFDGFLLDDEAVKRLGGVSEVIVPYLTGRELLDEFKVERSVIDFGNRDLGQASSFEQPLAHCQEFVLPAVRRAYDEAVAAGSDMAGARREHLQRWWQFWNRRDAMSRRLARLDRYVACSRVTRRPVMVFLSTRICPSDLVQVFALEDDYSFGILQSSAHFEWFRKSSRLKVETDTRYSVREIFETFPWPQAPTPAQVLAVAEAGRRVRRVRDALLKPTAGGLRGIYRLLELPGRHPLKEAHAVLDAAVLEAFGFSRSTDLLAQLLELNRAVAEAPAARAEVTAPGIPASYPHPSELITADCYAP
jgi:hypothetical protein